MLKEIKCPEWPMVSVLTQGHWTQGFAEFFSEVEGETPTHVHFYCTRQHARQIFRDLPVEHKNKIASMKTVSFLCTVARLGSHCSKCKNTYWPVTQEQVDANPTCKELIVQFQQGICWGCACKIVPYP